MVTSISHNPAETEQLGESWGRDAMPGLVIALSGDLGAGKTQLVKGLARGLGINAPVTSPTFALVNTYHGGRLPLYHLDLYRLETPELVIAAGLEEYFDPDGVSVIEWAERWFANRPPTRKLDMDLADSAPASSGVGARVLLRWVTIDATSEFERRISYEDFGH